MPSNLSGFTLFKVSKGWQLSTRNKGEDGWSVRLISEEQAENLLELLKPSLLVGAPATTNTPTPSVVTGQLNFRRERVRL